MIFLNIGWGRDINQAIEYAISEAKEKLEDQTFDFNGVTIIVCDKSDAGLIYRDWSRGMDGYLGKNPTVGPFPSATLSNEQLESDSKIRKENDAKHKLQQEKWAEEARTKKHKLDTAISNVPPVEFSNKPEWDKFVEANQDSYGSACIKYAEKWAMLMQAKIKDGVSVASCAGETGSLADDEEITGFMYGCAVSMLSKCWKHGEELRRWHNKDVQLGTEGDTANESGAVLNPACLVISN
jgi:hypothetical protein